MHNDDHDDFGGLHSDLRLTRASMKRRDMLRLALGASVIPLFGCGDSSTGGDPNTLCADTPEETAGPYPGDGSNGPNVLNQAGVVRTDIRSSLGGLTGTAAGIPLTVVLDVVSAGVCTPLAGYAVYLWHCDRAGLYSLYSAGATTQNYLRGVQASDANGRLTFTTIFPACYAGRWPHIHFEVYQSLAAATSSGNKIATSQLALPKVACDAVYATTGYQQSITNLSQVSLASDMVFADGASLETPTMSGDVTGGFTAMMRVSV